MNNKDDSRKCTGKDMKEFNPVVMTKLLKDGESYVCFTSTSMNLFPNTEKFTLIDHEELHQLFNSSLRKDVPGYFENKVDDLMNGKESLCIFNS